ncbi:MAG: TldD/PmbA family protein [Candidatus Odinarchaeota archaeon]
MTTTLSISPSIWKLADQVELFFEENSAITASIQASSLKSIKAIETQGGAARTYKQNRPGWSYSSNYDSHEKLVKQAITMAQQSTPYKQDVGFPVNEGKSGRTEEYADKYLLEIGLEEVNEIAGSFLEIINQFDHLSCRAKISAETKTIRVINSNGIDVSTTLTLFTVFFGVNYYDPSNEMTGGSVWGTYKSRYYDKEVLDSEINRFAGLASVNINPIRIQSIGDIIYSPECISSLLRRGFAPAISAKNVYLKKSPLTDKVGEELANVAILNEVADHSSGTSIPFDGEGGQTRMVTVIDSSGIFRTFLSDRLHANLLGITATSNLQRDSYDNYPEIGINNLNIQPRKDAMLFSEMLEETKHGVLANGFSGNVNSANGDFSGLLKGAFLIENGELGPPLKDINVRGNIYELLRQDFTRDAMRSFNDVRAPYVKVKMT